MSSIAWVYDLRVIQEMKVINWTGGGTFVTQRGYDPADRMTPLVYPGGEAVNSVYNDQGLLRRIYTTGLDYVQSTTYDVAGRVTQRVLGNPAVVQVGFSYYPWTTVTGQGRLQQLTAGIPGDLSSLQNLTYVYDAVGNVDWIKDWEAGSPQQQDFTYDRLNRLVNAVASGGANGVYPTETYGFAPNGNLTTKTGVGAYSYGVQASSCPEGALSKPHAAVTAGSSSYCYDQNGNMRRRTVGGSTYTLTYDAESRLVSISGAATASFAYDADGNRIKSVLNGETITYVGSLYEKKVVGSTTTHTKYYTFGDRRIAVRVAGTLSWLLSDHLGSTAVTADGVSGARTAELWYKPWGESRGTPFGATPTLRRFTGQVLDNVAGGLYFYNARYYDPALGRFIQADTIVPQPGNPQSLNRYSYVGNNPLRYVDPSGHRECEGASNCNGPDPALPAAPPAYGGPCISVVCLPTLTPAPSMMMPGTPDPQWVAPTATPYGGAWVGPGGPWTPTSTPHPYVPPSQRINRPSVYWAIVAAYNELPRVVSKFTPVTARAAGRTAVFVPFPEPVIKTMGIVANYGPNVVQHLRNHDHPYEVVTDLAVDTGGLAFSALTTSVLTPVLALAGQAMVPTGGQVVGGIAGFLGGSIGGSVSWDVLIAPVVRPTIRSWVGSYGEFFR